MPTIGPIQPIPLPDPEPARGGAVNRAGFRNVLQAAIEQVEGSSRTAEKAVEGFLSGEADDLHSVALATQRAELELDLFLQVRNKVVQAYQEIMRMQM
ncbi:MAG: flagellar hook-basal body complex protein FliE [Candidatus Solibacter usitatus]|nr:flagellar hook-basal body complex protein FliE [Candidatus Solibacter usitatus]